MKGFENLPIYLDYAATSPLDSAVFEAMEPFLMRHFGNAASRFHAYGWLAEEAVDEAKATISKHSGFGTKEIVFTSGATESINLALLGFFENLDFKGRLITVETEHKATLDTAKYLQTKGLEVIFLAVDENGCLDLDEMESHFSGRSCLLSVMQVNNETGVVQPLEGILERARSKNVKVHVDATQAVGKLPLPCDADLLSFSGHKIYGPKGMGALLVKKEVALSPQIHGGAHQRNRRSGTLNVPGIVGLAKAFEMAERERENYVRHAESLSVQLEKGILENLDFVAQINGIGANRVAGITNILFNGMDGEEILFRMNKVAVSNGSACNSASTEPSYVLKAMGLSDAEAYSSVRFSLGKFTTEKDIAYTVEHVCETIKEIRNANF
ncbi:cysteine desulfurase [Marinilongibacter aquaticus]|uniref:cysteine desulfurase family protein n=1 Tax=Marinilongibacter aquaticus TaxID=2975157 RepID=UPI0021BD1F2B|nr:cysteine desulfurase family protein [Marinilongibacter aquaticus]UBM57347.1 cysteine desulfurase [Marinilongibacter aquaticus]